MSIKTAIALDYPKDGQWFEDGPKQPPVEKKHNYKRTNALSALQLISIVAVVALFLSAGTLPFVLG